MTDAVVGVAAVLDPVKLYQNFLYLAAVDVENDVHFMIIVMMMMMMMTRDL